MSHQILMKHFPTFVDSDAPAAWAMHGNWLAWGICLELPFGRQKQSQVAFGCEGRITAESKLKSDLQEACVFGSI